MADFRANPAKSCLRQLAKYLNFSGALFIEDTSWLPRKLPSTFLSQEGPFSLVPIDVNNTGLCCLHKHLSSTHSSSYRKD